jgi:glutathione S-transferase
MKLLGNNLSPYVRKVITVLTVKGLEYQHDALLPRDNTAAFRAISPAGKIPAFIDGDIQIADSSVICEYLDEAYPEIPVMPSSPGDRARSRWLEEYADTVCASTVGVIFFERVAKPFVYGGEADAALVEQALREHIPPVQDYLESQLPQTGFIFERFGTVDIALASFFFQSAYAGYAVDAQRWPRLAAYLERVQSHPPVAATLSKEAAIAATLGKQ